MNALPILLRRSRKTELSPQLLQAFRREQQSGLLFTMRVRFAALFLIARDEQRLGKLAEELSEKGARKVGQRVLDLTDNSRHEAFEVWANTQISCRPLH